MLIAKVQNYIADKTWKAGLLKVLKSEVKSLKYQAQLVTPTDIGDLKFIATTFKKSIANIIERNKTTFHEYNKHDIQQLAEIYGNILKIHNKLEQKERGYKHAGQASKVAQARTTEGTQPIYCIDGCSTLNSTSMF